MTMTKEQIRKLIADKLSPESRDSQKDVLEIQEAIEVMRRSQEVQRERVEPFFRHRSYVIYRSS